MFSGLQVVAHHVLPDLAAIAQVAVVAGAHERAALAEAARLLLDGVLVAVEHIAKEQLSCGAGDSLALLVLGGGGGEEAHGRYLSSKCLSLTTIITLFRPAYPEDGKIAESPHSLHNSTQFFVLNWIS